jgi:hypothetical protein
MMSCSKVVREACEKDPKLRDFNGLDVDGIAGIFQTVVNFVHDDILPMGPGGHVECLSKEAQIYMQQMLRLYRFAIQYEMEDLADRTIDEIQAHERRCNGYPVMTWIQNVYNFSEPGSKVRLYCAASLYHSGIRIMRGLTHGCRASEFMSLRNSFPEAVDDIQRMEKVFQRESTWSNGKMVDHRDQEAFGACIFHLHPKGKICHATSPVVREARTFGMGWGNWDEPRTSVKLPIAYPIDYGSGTESDDDPVDEQWEAICGLGSTEDSALETNLRRISPGLGNIVESAVETNTKHTSPDFEDSGLSVEEEEEEETNTAPIAPRSTVLSPLPTGVVGDDESEKKKEKYKSTPPVNMEGFPIPNPWGFHLPPRDEAESDRLYGWLSLSPRTQAEADDCHNFLKQVCMKGLDRHFPKGPTQKVEKKSTPTEPKPLPKPVLKTTPKVFQPVAQPESAKTNIFTCKTCDRKFQRKEDFLKHVAQKDKLCVYRKRSRPYSRDESRLTPLQRLRKRPKLDYKHGD